MCPLQKGNALSYWLFKNFYILFSYWNNFLNKNIFALFHLLEAIHFYIFSYFLVCTTLFPNNMLIFKNMLSTHQFQISSLIFLWNKGSALLHSPSLTISRIPIFQCHFVRILVKSRVNFMLLFLCKNSLLCQVMII